VRQPARRCAIATRTPERGKPAPTAGGPKAGAPAIGFTPGVYALIGAVFFAIALLVYEPAFDGPFVSDDNHYLKNNSYIHELSLENLRIILDPFGASTIAIVNYAPVQLMIHALAWSAFGSEVTGHHVVNVAFHALASLLLVPLLARSGIAPLAALFGGAFFLLHPANVEAVAWMSQLKTTASMVFALAALLAFPKRATLATVCFVLALLAKPIAVFALPVAALTVWSRREPMPWRWLALWALLFVAFSISELSVHQRSGAAEAVLYQTPWVLVRTILALGMRYLVMAATAVGVSAFHEPDPAYALGDPWWLASLAALSLLAWRSWIAARRRNIELSYWVWALVAFAPVSQIFPFLYPLADRYLYFILPGLLGGALLAGREGFERALGRGRSAALRSRVAWALAGCGAIALIPLGVQSHARAAIWRSSTLLLADAARNYPDGVSASLLRAKRAAQQGDGPAAASALRAAYERGFNQFEQLLGDSGLSSVHDDPAFKAVISDMAQGWIESIATREVPSQGELRMVARAHVVRGEYVQAAEALRRALALGGRMDDQIRTDIENLSNHMR